MLRHAKARHDKINMSWLLANELLKICTKFESLSVINILANIIIGFGVVIAHKRRVAGEKDVANDPQWPHVWKISFSLTKISASSWQEYSCLTCACADEVVIDHLGSHKLRGPHEALDLQYIIYNSYI